MRLEPSPYDRDLIESFITGLAHAGSPRTAGEYRRIIERFAAEHGDPVRATALQVQRFAHEPGPSGRSPSPSTISVRLAALSALLDFATTCGVRPSNPCRAIRRPRPRLPAPRSLEPVEVERLLAAIPSGPAGDLDRAIVLTILYTGLRRREVLSLRLGDLAGRDPILFRCRVKGGRMRIAPLPDPAFEAIAAAWASAARRIDGVESNELLFGISSSTFYGRLRRHAAAAGLRPISPHVLRHTAAQLRRRAGASLEEIAVLLGHASLATTAVYLRRLEGHRDDRWPMVEELIGGRRLSSPQLLKEGATE